MADLEMVDRRIDKAQKSAKGGDKTLLTTRSRSSQRLRELSRTRASCARTFECSEDDAAIIATS